MKRLAVAALALLSLAPIVRAWRRGRAARPLERWQHPSEPAISALVSVIVPAWREGATLTTCLTSLLKVQYAGPVEIIVVAGGDDATTEAAQSFARGDSRVQALPQRSNAGKNGAMNDGASFATGDILVFLDADTVVSAGWLSALVAPLEGGYAASTGRFVPARTTLVSQAGEMSQVLENEARGRVLLQGSGGMAVRRGVFNALGGIPEGGAYADDWDLSQRLMAAGHRLAFAPTALCFSERPSNLQEWWCNELRWRRIHLISLFRVADVELTNPLRAARALYPYLTSWGGLVLSAATLLSLGRRGRIQTAVGSAWLALVAPALTRELAGPVETAAYTGQARWLRTALVLPVLTMLGWVAGALATLTTDRIQLHYKGPRRPAGAIGHLLHPASAATAAAVNGAPANAPEKVREL